MLSPVSFIVRSCPIFFSLDQCIPNNPVFKSNLAWNRQCSSFFPKRPSGVFVCANPHKYLLSNGLFLCCWAKFVMMGRGFKIFRTPTYQLSTNPTQSHDCVDRRRHDILLLLYFWLCSYIVLSIERVQFFTIFSPWYDNHPPPTTTTTHLNDLFGLIWSPPIFAYSFFYSLILLSFMRIHCVVMNTRLMKTLIKLWLATGLPYESITGTVAINDMNFNQTFMDNPRPSFFCADNEWPLCFVAGALLSLSLYIYI